MRRSLSHFALVLGFLLVAGLAPGRAAEDWADPNLKVTDGLDVWLDAARQNAARRALKMPELTSGSALDTWLDASGQRRHLTQKDGAAQPRLQSRDDYAAVRFDGQRHCLSGIIQHYAVYIRHLLTRYP